MELYATERFLHRLGRSQQRTRFILKGALLLRPWLGVDARPTRDIDLLGPADLDLAGLKAALVDIMEADVEDDAIQFDPGSIAVQPIRVGSAVLGMRAKFDGRLGQMRLRYQVDVGLGDAIYPPDVELTPGGLLGMPITTVRAYTPYTAVAEKLETVVARGDVNTRTKDYYDLFQIPRMLAFEGELLSEAIRRTFARRAVRIPVEPLEGLSDRFAAETLHAGRWRAFLAKNRLGLAGRDFAAVVAAIRQFAEPPLAAAHDDSPFQGNWEPGGPWR